jgi:predicted ATPase/DNA-binding winged helix-turn-helix (wHTH) protein
LDPIIYRCGDCQLDSGNRRFTRGGQEIVLEPKVFAVLVQLLRQPGELLSRDQLLDSVWGHRYVTRSTLNRVIALARRAFADDADRPKFIQTVHGAGYRYIGPFENATPVFAEPRARFGPPAAARIPARLQTLIGREQELARIGDTLGSGRSLTIVGTGGMGKTQCAIAAAHEQMTNFPDGVWFFDLAPLQQSFEWLQALALALSIAPTGERELLEKVTQALIGRRALLLLDNCDRLSLDVGALVVQILRATDHIKVLATSQQQLKYIGECVLRMPPLRLPGITRPTDEAEIAEVAAAPAVALLLARIRDTQPEFTLTSDNASAVVEICERLDGMPLALELAAARFASLSPDQVLERVDQRFRFLVSDQSGRDPRHRNLMTLLDWSYQLLSSGEQRLLAWFGVFVQGWTMEAAMRLASAFGETPEMLVDLLTGLASKSLVSVDQSVSPPRYRLLESVREFALQQLRNLGDEPSARDAHLAYVLHLTETAHQEMFSGRMRESIGLLMLEKGNIAAASEYALGAANDGQAALRIAGRLTQYFKAHGDWTFGRRICERAIAGASDARTRERGLALMCLGVNLAFSGKPDEDTPLLEAISICREVGDEWAAAFSSGYYALWLARSGRTSEATPYIETTERIARQRADEILAGLAGLALGWVQLAGGQVNESLKTLQQVRHLGGDYHQHHFIDAYIALCFFRRGDLALAAAQWLEAMRNAIAVGHTRGAAASIEGCGYIAQRLDKADHACRLLGASAKIRERTEIPFNSFWRGHNEEVNAKLRASLSQEHYEAAIGEGARMRQEDAINEAVALLREFSAAAP